MTVAIMEEIAKADRKRVKRAVDTLATIVHDAVDSADMIGYLLQNLEEVTVSSRLIVDFAIEQWNDDRPMTTQDSIGFLQLEYAVNSAIRQHEQPEGPLAWLAIVRLILKLLYTIENR